jgi:hypothetical protein
MKKENEKYTTNGVIERGYQIYDEWKTKKYKSRKIESAVSFAVSSMNSKNAIGARIEALSYLFALDLRIKERYKTILRCIIFFFAWRREKKALEWLKDELKLSSYSGDIYSLIEIELERIREIAELEELDGKDNRKKGGKARAVSDDEASKDIAQDETDLEKGEDKKIQNAKGEKKEGDEIAEEPDGEIIIKEEKKSEEKQAPSSQPLDEGEAPRSERIPIDTDALFKSAKENQQKNNINEENSGLENESKPIENKSNKNQETDPYVDVFPIFSEETSVKKEGKSSFIDEASMDNLAMGKHDFIGSGIEKEAGVQKSGTNESQANIINVEQSGADGKEAHLYDKMVLDMKNGQTSQSREQIKVDMSLGKDKENDFRKEVNDHIPEDNIIAFKEAGIADLRHRLNVHCEENGLLDLVDDGNGRNEVHGGNNQSGPQIISGIK